MIFADDVVLSAENIMDVEFQLEEWRISIEDYGMKISRTKMEYMIIGAQDDQLELAGVEIKKVRAFKYVDFVVQDDEHAVADISGRIQIGWQNLTDIICNNKIGTKLKGKLYKSVVRPAVSYGRETMPLTIVLEGKINTTEMRRLEFIEHVTRRDKIWDKEIQKFWSLATVKEMQESLIMIVSVDSMKERRLRRKRGHEGACRKEKKS